ncbi:glycosyltransferase family 2 protein [Patescibacteria group bacterium]|nr:MAG: glycosyltransferase family 2 protein [Patescibacteria group bacterium]
MRRQGLRRTRPQGKILNAFTPAAFMPPKIAVIYLSYNSLPYLPEVVSSWEKLDYPREALEIVIVDNASADGSAQWIRDHVLPKSNSVLPRVTFFPSGVNLGFAGGNNLGIDHALLEGADYAYLQNNDAKLDSGCIREAVALAQSDENIGSVQSFMRLWQDPEVVNSTGGMVHFLGFGFVRDNGRYAKDVTATDPSTSLRVDGEEIAYGSGAATLYRATALKAAGLLDDHLFLYHEDLELGWRLRLAGFRNVLSMKSVAFHRYEFSRSVQKLYWMERNRWLVHLSHLKAASLALIAPFMLVEELALAAFAIHGGWFSQKLKAWGAAFDPRTWAYVSRKRKESRTIRKVTDAEIVRLWTGRIEHQATSNPIVEKVANPVLDAIWRVVRKCIVW